MSYFAYPWMLAALIPAVAGIIYFLFFKKHPGVVLPFWPDSQTTSQRRFFRRTRPGISHLLISLAMLLLIVALARPRSGNEKFLFRQQGIDIVMVLDLSGSMQTFDVPQEVRTYRELVDLYQSGRLKNRLDIAKNELNKFIDQRPNDRIGLIGFAEYGYNFAPPTLDHEMLKNSLDMLEPGIIGDGTGIASPMASAIRRLDNSQAPRRVMVLFTDGVNNIAHRLTPLETAKLAKEKNIVIYTVGIGGGNSFALQDSILGRRFEPIQSSFDEQLLKDIAEATNGKYFRAADANAMNSVMNEINQLEKTNFEQPRHIEYYEYAPLLGMIAMLLVLVAVWLENTLERTVP
ncbi:MAG: VWA domain-containing protein [Lentisphaerae bacterium]|nr:VWA domain-containing protein [Lentisphaerota bacterium]